LKNGLKNTHSDLLKLVAIAIIGQISVSLFFSLPYAPTLGGDSSGFIKIANGLPSIPTDYRGYSGYLAVLKIGSLLGSATWFACIIQIIAVIAGSAALLSLGRMFKGNSAGWAASCIYLLCPLVNQWTRYVLTESLFYSGVIIVTWLTVKALKETQPNWPQLWIVLFLVSSLRPNGIILFISIISIVIFSRYWNLKSKIICFVGLILILFLVTTSSDAFNSGEESNHFGPHAWIGDVVWNVPEERIEMPEPVNRDPSNSAYVRYIIDNPKEMTRLALLRIGWELKQVRPWYSKQLNLSTYVMMTLFYGTALVGFWNSRKSVLTLTILGITVPFMLLIGITWAIWEGRFGWWFLVLWTIWSGIGVQVIIEFFRNLTKNSKLTATSNT